MQPVSDMTRSRRRLRGFFRRNRNLRGAALTTAAAIAAMFLAAAAWDALQFETRLAAAAERPYTDLRDRVLSGDGVASAEIDSGWLFVETDDAVLSARLPQGAPGAVEALFANARAPLAERAPRLSLAAVLSAILTLAFVAFVARYMLSMTGGLKGVGQALEVDEIDARFSDVAGAAEAKQDLAEFVAMIRGALDYRALGAKIPRGLLLVGPPGTGKTLLARAVAGEALVNFIAVAASDFGGVLVGQGARDVGALFAKARRLAPSVVFIDEIDSVGRRRDRVSHDDYVTTLNKLLAELDGIEGREGVFVIAATNALDALDPALIRPGRFDRIVRVPLPDLDARRRLLALHSRGLALGAEVDLAGVARRTAGFSGAQIEALCNEAAIQAGRRGAACVAACDFDAALIKATLGGVAGAVVLTEAERRRVAVHEAGHALVAWLDPAADLVERATIQPRGETLGHIHTVAEMERRITTATQLRARLRVFCAGRAAEMTVFGDDGPSTLALSDVEEASRLATEMARRFAMDAGGGFFAGPDAHPLHAPDPGLAARAAGLCETAMAEAVERIAERRADLDRLARALFDRETLSRAEIAALLGGAPTPSRDAWVA